MKNKLLVLGLAGTILVGCGINNNVSVATTNGTCPNGSGGNPYCMQVQVQNNAGGQNYINSTSFPITNLSVVISGASNILSPATSSSMDPNNCGGSTISPGGSCTFFLRINNESYAVSSMENVQVTLNYQINDTLFGGSSAAQNYSTNFNIYEFTNLYIMQNNGYLFGYNASGGTYRLVESSDTVNSIAVDTNSYGLLYMGGQLGIYQYGMSNNITSTSIVGTLAINNVNNLYTNSGNLYAVSGTGVWSWSLANESWNSNSALYPFSQAVATNANARSTTGVQYLASGTQVYACQSGTSSSTCANEANTLPNSVTNLAFLQSSMSIYTGLYAVTANGIYIESGVTPNPAPATMWNPITSYSGTSVSSLAVSNNTGVIFLGDSSGNIWYIASSNPTTVMSFANVPGNNAISGMTVDQSGYVLYFTAGSTLYSCSTLGLTCTGESAPATIMQINNNSLAGLATGSMLINTSTPF